MPREKSRIPIAVGQAILGQPDLVRINCPLCGLKHVHGIDREDVRPHRVAHCLDGDPSNLGYFIDLREMRKKG